MKRSERVERFLDSIKESVLGIENADFSDISVTDPEGENALHIAISQDELEIARELIELGIDIDARGNLGNTPLHQSAMSGKLKLVELLIENNADLFALNEGWPPFTSARMAGHDEICDLLGSHMQRLSHDKSTYVTAKIEFLKREIDRLEAKLKESRRE